MNNIPREKVEFELDCIPEDMPVRGNAMCSSDPELDRYIEDGIIADLECNEWAWCIARVTARYKGFEGADYLGGCSYNGPEEFKRNGYFDQMQDQALEALNVSIDEMRNRIAEIDNNGGSDNDSH